MPVAESPAATQPSSSRNNAAVTPVASPKSNSSSKHSTAKQQQHRASSTAQLTVDRTTFVALQHSVSELIKFLHELPTEELAVLGSRPNRPQLQPLLSSSQSNAAHNNAKRVQLNQTVSDLSHALPEQHYAATLIQAQFRGYRVRKQHAQTRQLYHALQLDIARHAEQCAAQIAKVAHAASRREQTLLELSGASIGEVERRLDALTTQQQESSTQFTHQTEQQSSQNATLSRSLTVLHDNTVRLKSFIDTTLTESINALTTNQTTLNSNLTLTSTQLSQKCESMRAEQQQQFTQWQSEQQQALAEVQQGLQSQLIALSKDQSECATDVHALTQASHEQHSIVMMTKHDNENTSKQLQSLQTEFMQLKHQRELESERHTTTEQMMRHLFDEVKSLRAWRDSQSERDTQSALAQQQVNSQLALQSAHITALSAWREQATVQLTLCAADRAALQQRTSEISLALQQRSAQHAEATEQHHHKTLQFSSDVQQQLNSQLLALQHNVDALSGKHETHSVHLQQLSSWRDDAQQTMNALQSANMMLHTTGGEFVRTSLLSVQSQLSQLASLPDSCRIQFENMNSQLQRNTEQGVKLESKCDALTTDVQRCNEWREMSRVSVELLQQQQLTLKEQMQSHQTQVVALSQSQAKQSEQWREQASKQQMQLSELQQSVTKHQEQVSTQHLQLTAKQELFDEQQTQYKTQSTEQQSQLTSIQQTMTEQQNQLNSVQLSMTEQQAQYEDQIKLQQKELNSIRHSFEQQQKQFDQQIDKHASQLNAIQQSLIEQQEEFKSQFTDHATQLSTHQTDQKQQFNQIQQEFTRLHSQLTEQQNSLTQQYEQSIQQLTQHQTQLSSLQSASEQFATQLQQHLARFESQQEVQQSNASQYTATLQSIQQHSEESLQQHSSQQQLLQSQLQQLLQQQTVLQEQIALQQQAFALIEQRVATTTTTTATSHKLDTSSEQKQQQQKLQLELQQQQQQLQQQAAQMQQQQKELQQSAQNAAEALRQQQEEQQKALQAQAALLQIEQKKQLEQLQSQQQQQAELAKATHDTQMQQFETSRVAQLHATQLSMQQQQDSQFQQWKQAQHTEATQLRDQMQRELQMHTERLAKQQEEHIEKLRLAAIAQQQEMQQKLQQQVDVSTQAALEMQYKLDSQAEALKHAHEATQKVQHAAQQVQTTQYEQLQRQLKLQHDELTQASRALAVATQAATEAAAAASQASAAATSAAAVQRDDDSLQHSSVQQRRLHPSSPKEHTDSQNKSHFISTSSPPLSSNVPVPKARSPSFITNKNSQRSVALAALSTQLSTSASSSNGGDAATPTTTTLSHTSLSHHVKSASISSVQSPAMTALLNMQLNRKQLIKAAAAAAAAAGYTLSSPDDSVHSSPFVSAKGFVSTSRRRSKTLQDDEEEQNSSGSSPIMKRERRLSIDASVANAAHANSSNNHSIHDVRKGNDASLVDTVSGTRASSLHAASSSDADPARNANSAALAALIHPSTPIPIDSNSSATALNANSHSNSGSSNNSANNSAHSSRRHSPRKGAAGAGVNSIAEEDESEPQDQLRSNGSPAQRRRSIITQSGVKSATINQNSNKPRIAVDASAFAADAVLSPSSADSSTALAPISPTHSAPLLFSNLLIDVQSAEFVPHGAHARSSSAFRPYVVLYFQGSRGETEACIGSDAQDAAALVAQWGTSFCFACDHASIMQYSARDGVSGPTSPINSPKSASSRNADGSGGDSSPKSPNSVSRGEALNILITVLCESQDPNAEDEMIGYCIIPIHRLKDQLFVRKSHEIRAHQQIDARAPGLQAPIVKGARVGSLTLSMLWLYDIGRLVRSLKNKPRAEITRLYSGFRLNKLIVDVIRCNDMKLVPLAPSTSDSQQQQQQQQRSFVRLTLQHSIAATPELPVLQSASQWNFNFTFNVSQPEDQQDDNAPSDAAQGESLLVQVFQSAPVAPLPAHSPQLSALQSPSPSGSESSVGAVVPLPILIGEARVPLSLLLDQQPHSCWCPLLHPEQKHSIRGRVKLSLLWLYDLKQLVLQ